MTVFQEDAPPSYDPVPMSWAMNLLCQEGRGDGQLSDPMTVAECFSKWGRKYNFEIRYLQRVFLCPSFALQFEALVKPSVLHTVPLFNNRNLTPSRLLPDCPPSPL